VTMANDAAFFSDHHRLSAQQIASPTASAAFLIKTMLFLIFTLSAPIMNMVVPYSLPGGSALVKFHPATWLSFFLCLAISSLHVRPPLHQHYARAAVLFFAVTVWLMLQGKGAFASTLLDIHFSVAVLLMGLTVLSFEQARSAVSIFVWIAALNVAIVVFEFFARTHVLPIETYEAFFRPAGLFGHPIACGMMFGCSMIIVSRGAVGAELVRPLMVLFLLGTAICGVRGPLAAAIVIFTLNLIWPSLPRQSPNQRMFDLATAIFLPLAAVGAWAIGAFDRILAAGLWEDSTQSRFYIFEPISWLTSAQFWNGIDDYGTMEYLARQATGGSYVENSFVAFVFSSGILIAIFLSIIIVYFHLPALSRSLSFIVIFLFFVMGTIGFSSKGQTSAAMALAGYWVCRSMREERSNA
ncbi:MAG: hypothetical protein ABIN69_12820, partial [Aestuariivirga sp.]